MLEFIGFLLIAIFGWVLAEIGRNLFDERNELKMRLSLLRILNEEIKFNFDLASEEMKHGVTKHGEGQLIPFQIEFYQGSVSHLYFLEPDMYSNIQTHYIWIKAYLTLVSTFIESLKLPHLGKEEIEWLIKKNDKEKKNYIKNIQSNGEQTTEFLINSISQLELDIERFLRDKLISAWNFVKSLLKSRRKED